MIEGTFDVRIYNIERRKRANGYTYKVVWKVGTKKHSKTYPTKALADARRSDLLTAVKRGEPFSTETGQPISYSSKAAETNWYDFAVEFVDKSWTSSSANHRKNVAKAMTPATIALLRTPPKQFDAVKVRTALREWAFNTKRRTNPEEPIPDDIRVILDWVQRNTLPMSAWEQTEKVDVVVKALGTLLDGTAAAASSVSRNRRIMNLAMDYAVRHGILRQNPLPKGKGSGGGAPKVAQAIDKRSLLNPQQVTALLDWIGKRPRRGLIYRAFFATLCYGGLRPEEAVALRVSDASLPETGWGEFVVHQATPEVGSQWTDSGDTHDDRDLKGRAEGDTRTVPIHPDLVAFLREIIERYKLKPTDLLFPGEGGGKLAGSVFRRVWEKARKAVLAPHEFASPAGKRVYDCRHTCLTAWLNKGIPPAQVAEWAGNSVPVLLAIYARCIVGQLANYLKQIEDIRYVPEAA
ncbi:tyrosine-type recombinase/integrase [Streptomyces sp. NRRL F-5650]|uniref:tyrosine-type recombinase/integrase n=1 Tax=Streptomyces sp. NRRL F-5650 TaxID=1463868 RepID=UPI000A6764FF|nr:tyrosine-type recombinase/integrase [Streptomyces sp. NRRL F-5650]